MTFEQQLAAIGSIEYWHQKEMKEAAYHVNSSLRLLMKLEAAGLPLNDPDKIIALWQQKHLKDKSKHEHYAQFVDLYFMFCKSYIGIDPIMDGRQGKALNEIITYLVSQSKTKNEAGALTAWEFILKNWNNVTIFIRNQTTLAQIKKNLQEILTQLRNGTTNQQQGRRTSASIRARAKSGATVRKQ